MAAPLLLLLALAAGDERIGVAVLPVDPSVDAVVRTSIPPDFELLPLEDDDRELLAGWPACRDTPACLAAHLPASAALVLDPRLSSAGDLWVLDLRLRTPEGVQADRVSESCTREGLPAAMKRDVARLLAGRTKAARLYEKALSGDEAAAAELRRRFPASDYALALPPR